MNHNDNDNDDNESTQSKLTAFTVGQSADSQLDRTTNTSQTSTPEGDSPAAVTAFWQGVAFTVSVIGVVVALSPLSVFPLISGTKLLHGAYL